MAGSRGLDVILTVLARFGGKSINLLVFILVARSLSLTDLGIYGFVFSATLVLSTVLDLGVRNSLAIFVGRDPDSLVAYTRAAGFLWLVAAPLCVPIVYVTLFISGFDISSLRIVAPAVVILGSMVFLRMLQGTLLGKGAIAQFNQSELASRVVLLVVSVSLFFLNMLTLDAALWTLALSQAVSAIFLAVLLRGSLFSAGVPWLKLARSLVVRGAPFMIAVLMMNASKRVSFFGVGQWAGVEDAGLFFGLQRLTEIITEVGLAVSVVVFSASVRTANKEEAAANAAYSSRVSMMMFLAVAVVFSASSPWSLPILLGPEFAVDLPLFQLLLIATLIGSTWTILFPAMSVLVSPSRMILFLLPGLLVNVVLVLALTPTFGTRGAAFALLVSNVVLAATFLAYFRKAYRIPVSDFLWPKGEEIGRVVQRVRSKLRKSKP